MGCNTSKETGAASSKQSTGPAVQAKGQASVKETKSNEETMVSGEMPMYYYYAESLPMPMPWGIMYHSAASERTGPTKIEHFQKGFAWRILL
jgi:hypothetical protein